MAVIKQNDAQMADLQRNLQSLIADMKTDYPNLSFEVTRDQTQLLSYSMANLEWNLVLGAIMACFVLFLFLGGWKMPLLVTISIPLSLILTLLCFYAMGISMNIISLSGLILGVGMKTSLTAMTTEVSWQRPLCLMLSMTMMALSTIMPTPSMRPERDMMFMEMPMA